METCTLCPRQCGARRETETGEGVCHSGTAARIARAAPHFWEEPPISGERGSGAVFFTGCALGCVFCQNQAISRGGPIGRLVSPEELAGIFQALEGQGVHNINLVTGAHFVPAIREALTIRKPAVPVVWNTSGYETVESLRLLEGLVDIYLPDLKYLDAVMGLVMARAPNYTAVAVAAIREMLRQVGPLELGPDGLARRGVLIRHLILPGHTGDSLRILELLAEEFPGAPVSLMAQYVPPDSLPPDPVFRGLDRRITRRELEKVQDRLFALGMDGFVQDLASASDKYVPEFDLL